MLLLCLRRQRLSTLESKSKSEIQCAVMQVPGELDLELVLAQLHLTLGSASVAAHNKWLATMSKLFARIRAAALAARTRLAQRRTHLAARRVVDDAATSMHDHFPPDDNVRLLFVVVVVRPAAQPLPSS